MIILQFGPGAPLLLRVAAELALVLHVGGASLALVSGAAALVVRKGGRLHRWSGVVFAVSMLVMSGIAAVVAPLLPDRVSAMMGLFAFYLTVTGWMAVTRRAPVGRGLEVGACVFVLGIALADLVIAWFGPPGGEIDGQSSQILYAFSAVAVFRAALDASVLRRGVLTGGPRIARHLWRMCFAFFICEGSFAAQPKAVPEALHGSPLVIAPGLAALLIMIAWLIRLRLPHGRLRPRFATT